MSSKPNEIRKRIAKRKRERDRLTRTISETSLLFSNIDEPYQESYPSFDSRKEDDLHPLFRKDVFLFKILLSTILVFVVAICFRNGDERLEPVREFVMIQMEQDFQFTAVANWYEEQFGEPLALLPFTEQNTSTVVENELEYALPASGKILEDFGENGQKVTIETPKGTAVTAMSGGRVVFVGEKEEFGQTVVIQHSDESETWYGHLSEIDVSIYEYVDKGSSIGKATETSDGLNGSFYFALKKDNAFVDPFQVIESE